MEIPRAGQDADIAWMAAAWNMVARYLGMLEDVGARQLDRGAMIFGQALQFRAAIMDDRTHQMDYALFAALDLALHHHQP